MNGNIQQSDFNYIHLISEDPDFYIIEYNFISGEDITTHVQLCNREVDEVDDDAII